MDFETLVLVTWPSAVGVMLTSVAISVSGRRLQRLADRIEALEDKLHDLTCHPADRVRTGSPPPIEQRFSPPRSLSALAVQAMHPAPLSSPREAVAKGVGASAAPAGAPAAREAKI
jgi:hypothetical protein